MRLSEVTFACLVLGAGMGWLQGLAHTMRIAQPDMQKLSLLLGAVATLASWVIIICNINTITLDIYRFADNGHAYVTAFVLYYAVYVVLPGLVVYAVVRVITWNHERKFGVMPRPDYAKIGIPDPQKR